MALYIDRHDMHEYTPEQIAADHLKDLEVQGKYGANFFSYFVDYPSESVCCLVEAPDKEAVMAAHGETCGEGDMPSNVIEVTREAIEAFLGPVGVPRPREIWDEIAFRTIVWLEVDDTDGLIRRLGDAKAAQSIREVADLSRQVLASEGGREVKQTRSGILASFRSAARALDCAIAIQRHVAVLNRTRPDARVEVRVGVNAGEPVTSHGELFGAAVQLAEAVCDTAAGGQIVVSGGVRDICLGKQFAFTAREPLVTPYFDEPVRLFEVTWTAGPSADAADGPARLPQPDGLSAREVEVLCLLASGKSNQQMADELVISVNTVIRHVSNIYTKAGVCNRAEATSYAYRNGIV